MQPELQKKIQEAFEKPADRFINRELSWLKFNQRVLEEAQNKKNPLLERLRFLSISSSNLNEFYMVRVSGIYGQIMHGVEELSQDGRTPRQQLTDILKEAVVLRRQQQICWDEIRSELEKEKMIIVGRNDLAVSDKEFLAGYWENNIFPALTPIAVDHAHPFPFLPNLGLAIVLELKKVSNVKELDKDLEKKKGKSAKDSAQAIIPLPSKLNRFIKLPTEEGNPEDRYVLLEEVIQLMENKLFTGYEVKSSGVIRIIRDSELEVSDEVEDLLLTFETAVKQRRKGDVVRLELDKNLSQNVRKFVMDELGLIEEDIEEIEGMLGLDGAVMLCDLQRPELKYPPYTTRFPERINDFNGDCFAAIKAKDIVVHHPYESFDVVVQFIRQAAADPDVVAIKQTLYRTSNDSPIVHALIGAAEAGKSVTVVVELKARFDEEANIRWGRNLERAGAQVVYGLSGLKTHSKITLIVRKEEEKLVSYVHYGTGNYHPVTAKVYADLSFFTTSQPYCRDAAQVFNYLTGYSTPQKFEKITVAPLNLRKTFVELIDNEIANAKAGKPANIWAKMNSLVDADIIDKLYEASHAGVKINLVIRGICCLKPGVKGISENISVKSIVGRFLEHSRIFCFGDGNPLPHPNAKVFISSADWMHRNLDRRIEILIPIENPTVHAQIIDQIMVSNMKDKKQSWVMNSDGTYNRAEFADKAFSAHEYFMTNPSLSGRGKAIQKAIKPS